MIDKDIYAYMNKVHKSELNEIERRYRIEFNCKVTGDAAIIEVLSRFGGADPHKGAKALEDLNRSVSYTADQDVVEIGSHLPLDTAENIFPFLGPEFPQVHMARVAASPNQIIFVAPDDSKCSMAVDMFKHYLQRAGMQQR